MADNNIRRQYASACRNLDPSHVGFEANLLPISNDYPSWTSKGKIGTYIWRSLTSLYVPGFVFVNPQKKAYNDHHLSCTHRGGNGMASMILNSIHEDKELESILQDLRVVNTDIMYNEYSGGPFLKGLNTYLKEYTDYRDCEDVLRLSGPSNLGINNVKGQDLVFTFPMLDPNSIKQFVHLAYASIQMGANTVMAIFVTRMMQNGNGEFPTEIPAEYGFPAPARGYSFSELCDMMGDEIF